VFLGLLAFSFSMLGAFLVRSGVLTSVHAFAVDPTRGAILLGILAVAVGSALSLFVWRAPALRSAALFGLVSRESALVVNNLFLATAALTVAAGTLYPLIYQAATSHALSVGAPFFNLTFAPLMTVCLVMTPFATLLAWKRGDLGRAAGALWAAGLAAIAAAGLTLVLTRTSAVFIILGVALGTWLIGGSLTELAGRARLGKASLGESLRRLGGLPRGAFGSTIAHIGVGVFILGACVETNWRVEATSLLSVGQSLKVGAYALRLDGAATVDGPNYSAERATITATKGEASQILLPERRFYPANRQSLSQVAIAREGVSDLYVVFGERREGAQPSWLIRAYFNPFARLIFAGPFLIALGGLVSLSDRRLRLAAGRKAGAAAKGAATQGGQG
jgi:cytochrome c-type biogenesis protein CcmF